jgi:hypothetical protein
MDARGFAILRKCRFGTACADLTFPNRFFGGSLADELDDSLSSNSAGVRLPTRCGAGDAHAAALSRCRWLAVALTLVGGGGRGASSSSSSPAGRCTGFGLNVASCQSSV